MRVYWLIGELEKPLYTAKAVRIIMDKQTGKEYTPSRMEFFKKNDAPKVLAEDTGKYDFFPMQRESHIEKVGLFRKRTVITKVSLPIDQKELMGVQGFWPIEGFEPITYTNKACDRIRCKATNKEYKLGKRVLFKDENYPFPLAEHTDKFDFIYYGTPNTPMTQEDYACEIWVNHLFDSKK